MEFTNAEFEKTKHYLQNGIDAKIIPEHVGIKLQEFLIQNFNESVDPVMQKRNLGQDAIDLLKEYSIARHELIRSHGLKKGTEILDELLSDKHWHINRLNLLARLKGAMMALMLVMLSSFCFSQNHFTMSAGKFNEIGAMRMTAGSNKDFFSWEWSATVPLSLRKDYHIYTGLSAGFTNDVESDLSYQILAGYNYRVKSTDAPGNLKEEAIKAKFMPSGTIRINQRLYEAYICLECTYIEHPYFGIGLKKLF